MPSPAGLLCRAFSLIITRLPSRCYSSHPTQSVIPFGYKPSLIVYGLRYCVPPFTTTNIIYRIRHRRFRDRFCRHSWDLRLSFQRPHLISTHKSSQRPSSCSYNHIHSLSIIFRTLELDPESPRTKKAKRNPSENSTRDTIGRDQPGFDFRSSVHRRSWNIWTASRTAEGGDQSQTPNLAATAVTSKLDVRNTPRTW